MPNVCSEREDRIAVSRRIVVGQHDTHLVQIAKYGFTRNPGILDTHDGLASVPNLIFCRKSYDVLLADNIRKGAASNAVQIAKKLIEYREK